MKFLFQKAQFKIWGKWVSTIEMRLRIEMRCDRSKRCIGFQKWSKRGVCYYEVKTWLLSFALVAALVHAIDTMHAELRMKKRIKEAV